MGDGDLLLSSIVSCCWVIVGTYTSFLFFVLRFLVVNKHREVLGWDPFVLVKAFSLRAHPCEALSSHCWVLWVEE